jgi:hypothetical protein
MACHRTDCFGLGGLAGTARGSSPIRSTERCHRSHDRTVRLYRCCSNARGGNPIASADYDVRAFRLLKWWSESREQDPCVCPHAWASRDPGILRLRLRAARVHPNAFRGASPCLNRTWLRSTCLRSISRTIARSKKSCATAMPTSNRTSLTATSAPGRSGFAFA